MSATWLRFKFILLYLALIFFAIGLYYVSPLYTIPHPLPSGYSPVSQFDDPISGLLFVLMIALKYLIYDSIAQNIRAKRSRSFATIIFWMFYVVMLLFDTWVLFIGSEPGPVGVSGLAMGAGLVVSFLVFLVSLLFVVVASFIPYHRRTNRSKMND